jgi:hypothetical protein
VRASLERFHGHPDPQAVQTLWPYLADPDRAIRFAARTALEWQDPAAWWETALLEPEPRRAIAALVALARVSGKDIWHRDANTPAPDSALQTDARRAGPHRVVESSGRRIVDCCGPTSWPSRGWARPGGARSASSTG